MKYKFRVCDCAGFSVTALCLLVPHFSGESPHGEVGLAIQHDLIDVGVQPLKLTQRPTSGLRVARSGFWLRIASMT